MTQALAHSPQDGSRLVRFLSELTAVGIEVSHKQFAERLGQLIDLADSFKLSSAHVHIQQMAFEPMAVPVEAVRDEFLRVRTTMIESVISSFASGPGTARIRLPALKAEAETDLTALLDAYIRFYLAHQRQIDFNIQTLRTHVRGVASGISAPLAQLAALDTTLGDTLATHSRACFGAIPRLLRHRMTQLLEEQQLTDSTPLAGAPEWDLVQQQFSSEIRGLLLAEIETRLLPVLGLIEAINENTDR